MITHILGVNDVSQIDADAALGDLGLDSLMGVEIRQALERDFDVVLSMKDIRNVGSTRVNFLFTVKKRRVNFLFTVAVFVRS